MKQTTCRGTNVSKKDSTLHGEVDNSTHDREEDDEEGLGGTPCGDSHQYPRLSVTKRHPTRHEVRRGILTLLELTGTEFLLLG